MTTAKQCLWKKGRGKLGVLDPLGVTEATSCDWVGMSEGMAGSVSKSLSEVGGGGDVAQLLSGLPPRR